MPYLIVFILCPAWTWIRLILDDLKLEEICLAACLCTIDTVQLYLKCLKSVFSAMITAGDDTTPFRVFVFSFQLCHAGVFQLRPVLIHSSASSLSSSQSYPHAGERCGVLSMPGLQQMVPVVFCTWCNQLVCLNVPKKGQGIRTHTQNGYAHLGTTSENHIWRTCKIEPRSFSLWGDSDNQESTQLVFIFHRNTQNLNITMRNW